MTNAERFLNAYAICERKLSEIANVTKYVSFSTLLARCAKQNKIVSLNQQSLREYNELRNAIVHSRGADNKIIAEPSDSVTKDIERIADLLQNDRKIMNYASSPVRTVTLEDDVHEVFELMDELGTSKIPVYDGKKFEGLVTIEDIARWGLYGDEKKATVQVLLHHNEKNRVLFVAKNGNVELVMRAYENALQKGNKLLAIIVTEHGSNNEKPAGIITAADLPRILADLI